MNIPIITIIITIILVKVRHLSFWSSDKVGSKNENFKETINDFCSKKILSIALVYLPKTNTFDFM